MNVNLKVVLLTIFSAICFMVAGFSLGDILNTKTAFSFLDYIFTPITTLVAAFGGSWYAFKLQADNAKRDSNEKNIKAANNAIFELTRWYNKLYAFRIQFISEHVNNPLRHFMILPVAGTSLGYPKFDYDSLAFIFKSNNPNLLGTLSLTELEITSTIDIIHQRSKMHSEILQPAVEEVEKKLGTHFDPAEIEIQLGSRHSKVIRMLTDYMVNGVNDSLELIRKHIDFIKTETELMYPGHVVIGMIDPLSALTSESGEQTKFTPNGSQGRTE